MTNQPKQPVNLKSFFTKVALIGLALDLVWAVAVATLYATGVFAAAGAADTGTGVTVLGTGLTWFVVFVVAFIQGAIFELLAAAFVAMGFIVYAVLAGQSKRGTADGGAASDREGGEVIDKPSDTTK